MSDPNQNLAPNFAVAISDSLLGVGLTELVQSLEYESVDGIIDEARLTLSNPDLILSNSPIWQPGNELDIWFGYGAELGYVGRVIIVRPELDFPRGDDVPTIMVKGYTKDQLLMQNSPGSDKSATRDFKNVLIHDAIAQVAKRGTYNFDTLDIDETPNRNAKIQKSDMSDYDFIKGMSNLVGYYFWIDYSPQEEGGTGWTLHFKNPETLVTQENIYTFQYNLGDKSTLLDFRPELSMTGAVTKIQAQCRDPKTNKLFVVEFNDDEEAPDVRYTGDPESVIDEEHTTAGAVVKLFFGDYAIETVSDKKFKTKADLTWWAQNWFRAKRENFIIGRGTVIGIPDLRARQTHTLKGLAESLDGDYYFARVRHTFNADDGYLVDFTARKQF